jgi:hypothetical protein
MEIAQAYLNYSQNKEAKNIWQTALYSVCLI